MQIASEPVGDMFETQIKTVSNAQVLIMGRTETDPLCGAHDGLIFRGIPVSQNGLSTEIICALLSSCG